MLVLSNWFSTFMHINLRFKCVFSQGFYQLEAKFTAFTHWGTQELLFSQSKVKAYMKQLSIIFLETQFSFLM